MLRIGQAQVRFEDDALIRGQGRYTSDVRVAGEAAAVILRSPVAAGRIRSIDTGAAQAAPGVIAVFTGEDMASDGVGSFRPRIQHPGPDGGPMRVPVFRPLAVGEIGRAHV